MKRSSVLGICAGLWIAVLGFLFAVPAWFPRGAERGVAMAWFLLQKGPAVLVLYLATDFLFYHRKQETLSMENLKDFLRNRRTAAFLFILGVALFATMNLL